MCKSSVHRHSHPRFTIGKIRAKIVTNHSDRILMRPGSMTEKWPAQSLRAIIASATFRVLSRAFFIGMRIKTIPHVFGSLAALASSPKSLSKVSKMRSSLTLHASQGHRCPALCFLSKRRPVRRPRGRQRPIQESSHSRETAYQAALGKTFSELNVSRA